MRGTSFIRAAGGKNENRESRAEVRLRFTIERKIDLVSLRGIIFYFILKMENATRRVGWRCIWGEGEEWWEGGGERTSEARQFRSRGEIDRDDVQIILF